ncbi:MAG: hypothetical protein J3K34DRAFT_428490, partial [Monoraphidium minutum]
MAGFYQACHCIPARALRAHPPAHLGSGGAAQRPGVPWALGKGERARMRLVYKLKQGRARRHGAGMACEPASGAIAAGREASTLGIVCGCRGGAPGDRRRHAHRESLFLRAQAQRRPSKCWTIAHRHGASSRQQQTGVCTQAIWAVRTTNWRLKAARAAMQGGEDGRAACARHGTPCGQPHNRFGGVGRSMGDGAPHMRPPHAHCGTKHWLLDSVLAFVASLRTRQGPWTPRAQSR